MKDTIQLIVVCIVVLGVVASCSYEMTEQNKSYYAFKTACFDKGGYMDWTSNCVVPK